MMQNYMLKENTVIRVGNTFLYMDVGIRPKVMLPIKICSDMKIDLNKSAIMIGIPNSSIRNRVSVVQNKIKGDIYTKGTEKFI